MKIEIHEGCLRVAEIPVFAGPTVRDIQICLRGALVARVLSVEVDLSQTTFMDSAGLGAILSTCGHAKRLNPEARFTILDPNPLIERLLKDNSVSLWVDIRHRAVQPA